MPGGGGLRRRRHRPGIARVAERGPGASFGPADAEDPASRIKYIMEGKTPPGAAAGSIPDETSSQPRHRRHGSA